MISSLFAQFRHQYANGSLTTELLMVHAEQHLVKATVTIDGQIVVTALAADATLIIADDQAKIRVLTMLGISEETHPENQNTSTLQTTVEIPADSFPDSSPSSDSSLPDIAATPAEHVDSPITTQQTEFEVPDSEDIGRPIDSITPDEAPAPAEVPASSLAATAIKNFDDTNPVDLSDIIAQTDVEMARLGWSNLQGRTYLEKTFNKRSRQQLTDEELLTFLLYLESQTTPSLG